MKKIVPICAAVAAAAMMLSISTSAMAMGGPSGPHVTYPVQGNIGEVIVNPYKVAPLTAVIRDAGYDLSDVTVRIVPKTNGQEITYKVSRTELKTHAGIPVFGLYPDWQNTVEVSYTRTFQGKSEKFKDTYRFYVPSVYTVSTGMPNQVKPFEVKPVHVDPDFSDRLYLINSQLMSTMPVGSRFVWNNPSGGAVEWAFNSNIGIIDTKGEVRWWLLDQEIGDNENPWKSGYFMGFQQTKDGALTWGYGQNYCKYDLIGRKVYDRRLPSGYSDFSHSFDNAQNGHSFLRVGSADYRRADGRRVHTVRDVIVEIDQDGRVVDDFRLMEILDPYATTSSRRSIRAQCVSILMPPRPVRPSAPLNLPKWIKATTSVTLWVSAQAATGPTSIPSTTIRRMTRSSFRPATSPPPSRLAAIRK